MFVSDSLSVNAKGHLTIAGVDTTEIAKEFGTPVIAYDEKQIRDNCRQFVKSIEENYNGNGLVLYASKAFSCKEMYRICSQEGMGTDVVSGGELYTALSVGFPAEKIYFHGNNKTLSELSYAVDAGVGRIVVDNLTELENLNRIAGEKGKNVDIMFRIKPGIDAHTHSFIQTGQIDSKFGFALETGEAMQAVKKALSMENVTLRGIHCHIGSQIFDIDPFELAASVMIGFMGEIKRQTGEELGELNLGGGFGIKYMSDDEPQAYSAYMNKVAAAIKAQCKKEDITLPYILIEPGRAIVGDSAVTLYTVGAVKHIPEIRTYVSVDGGMGDNPRYILYQSPYTVLCANKVNDPCKLEVTIAGRCCESGDLIQENVLIPEVESGDILAVLSTGAYNYSMAMNYNRIPKPPVVMVNNGETRLIIKGESYDDLIRNDI